MCLKPNLQELSEKPHMKNVSKLHIISTLFMTYSHTIYILKITPSSKFQGFVTGSCIAVLDR